ncbi:acyl-CoA dehydrogenase family protein [Sporichthya polymorpha]|uniref:acyl-CoA dehydrogenase family protein n=1 Tax=Sporichthya polymorpha TaxID=35751 RepID=UPI0003804E2C|nr:acyl-CoA dehydrogenase family protein [Sporichthya polymorpha]
MTTLDGERRSDTGTATEAAFRDQLRAFLAEHGPGKRPADPADRLAWQKGWMETLCEHGFAAPSWPKKFGGMDLPFDLQVVYAEEFARARVPAPLGTGLGIVAPTIIKFGTPDQQDRWLRPMLRGDKIWAQGFSEPGAGSDLPSLRTSARRDGDHYVVNGQKVWTTKAVGADMLYALVRTGAPDSRQDGISYLMIDLHSPGVTVRPLPDITGEAEFAEVFLDDVRVPVADRLGPENGAWPLVRNSLGHERAAGAMNQATMYRRVVDELVELARDQGRAAEPHIRAGLVDFDIRVRMMRYFAMRVISDIRTKGELGPASSVSRLWITAFEQELHEFAVDLLGPFGVLGRGDELSVQRNRWTTGFLKTRASTIGTGTTEVQKNAVAEQILSLPYDPAMPPR